MLGRRADRPLPTLRWRCRAGDKGSMKNRVNFEQAAVIGCSQGMHYLFRLRQAMERAGFQATNCIGRPRRIQCHACRHPAGLSAVVSGSGGDRHFAEFDCLTDLEVIALDPATKTATMHLECKRPPTARRTGRVATLYRHPRRPRISGERGRCMRSQFDMSRDTSSSSQRHTPLRG